eukprot:gnl/Chilomastix_cuspidata/68.p1 GENE.gnl/Chilomastix_cuspidata/68~~gnl/Chilomastix_cuspidata/68.p1  ORF type:complete len:799 (-),score=526.43 gnl/Chilomastix_cuspidata/68:1047-3443(-)
MENVWQPSDAPLPPFASEENKLLQKQIEKLGEQIRMKMTEIDDYEERSKVMVQHQKNVEQELSHAQLLLEARHKEISSEEHMTQLIKRDSERIRALSKAAATRLNEYSERHNSLQNDIFREQNKLRELEKEAQWNRNEFTQWRLAQQQKADDSFALQKYAKVDDAQLNQLAIRIVDYEKQAQRLRERLDEEVTDTRAAQLALDKAAEDFEQLQQERQELVERFQQSVQAMEARDEQISQISQHIQQYRARNARLQEELHQRRQSLEDARKQTARMQSAVRAAEREKEDLMKHATAAQQEIEELKDQASVVRTTLSKTEGDVSTAQAELRRTQLAGRERKARLERLRRSLEAAHADIEALADKATDAAERARITNELLNKAQEEVEDEQTKLRKTKERLVAATTQLHGLKRAEQNLNAEIKGSRTLIKNLNSRVAKLDESAEHQRNHLYTIDYQIQMLERQIMRVSGERSEEEVLELKKMIGSLEQQLAAETETKKLLTTQMKALQKDLNRCRRTLESLEKNHADIDVRLNDLTLASGSAEREQRDVTRRKEELMLDFDLLKMRATQLQGTLTAEADTVYALENRLEQLKLSIEERRREVAMHQEMLRGEHKMAAQEEAALRKELREARIFVEKLRAKFLVVAARMSGGGIERLRPGASNEEEIAHIERARAEMVVRVARENAELKEKAEKVRGSLEAAQKELAALENTLQVLGRVNTQHRQSLLPASGGASIRKDLAQFKNRLQAATSKLMYHQQELKQLVEEIAFAQTTVQNLQGECDELAEKIQDVEFSTQAAAGQ